MSECIRCINCSHEARWCDSKPIEFEGDNGETEFCDHECTQITCDHCGMQYDLINDETLKAETIEDGKNAIRKAYHGISQG